MDKDNPSEWWLITPEELKKQFEASPIIQPVIRRSLVGVGGEWVDGIWHYFDSELMKRFAIFCEGFMQGAIAVVSVQSDQKEQARNMRKQLKEKDEEGIYNVIDIEKYRDIGKE